MAVKDHKRRPAFVRDGFVLLDRSLNGSGVTDIQTVVDSVLDSPPDSARSPPHNTLVPFRWNNRIVQMVLASADRNFFSMHPPLSENT